MIRPANPPPRGSWRTVGQSRWIQVFIERRGVFVRTLASVSPVGLFPKETMRRVVRNIFRCLTWTDAQTG